MESSADCLNRVEFWTQRWTLRRTLRWTLPWTLQRAMRVGPLVLLSASAIAQSTAPGGGRGAVNSLPDISVQAPLVNPSEQGARVGGISEAPIAETPQSITVLRGAAMRDEGASSLSSAIRSEPSVSNFYNTVGYIESLQIRGFLLDNTFNYRRDGMPVSNYAPAAFENKQSIEILKGVSGIQSGVSAPGGLVNYVLKRPTVTPLRELYLGWSERGTKLLHLDVGGRGGVGDVFGYRVNAAYEDKRPMVDNAQGKREFLSGFFDLRLPARALLEAEFEYQKSRQPSVPGYSLLDTSGTGVATTVPAVPNPRTNLAAQSWALPFEAKNKISSLRFQQQLDNGWVWGFRAGQQTIRINDRLPFPDGCSSGANYVYPGFCGNGDFDLYDYRSENERRTMRSFDAFVRGEVKTGSVRHELSFGALRTNYQERLDPRQAYNFVGVGNIYTPVSLPSDPSLTSLNTNLDARSTEFSVADAIRFDQRWSLWLGLRSTRIERSSERSDGSRAVSYDQSFTTPWGALGYQPWAGGYAYVSAGSGVESEVVPNRPTVFTNAGEALPALRSQQKELGFKQALADGGLASIALFRIDKPYSDDVLQADGRNLRVAGGRTLRHQGLELSWLGRLAPAWTVQAQAMLIDTKATNSVDPTLQGKRTPNVAPATASVALTWAVPEIRGLGWTNRLQYSDKKAVTRDNSVEIPAYWQLDTYLVHRSKSGEQTLTWRVGIDNVLDKRYWRDAPTQYWGGTYLFAAPPRTFRASVQTSF